MSPIRSARSWKLNARGEFGKSDYNAWQIGPGLGDPVLGPSYSYTDGFVYTGSTRLFSTTVTLDYALWANVITLSRGDLGS